MDKFLKFISLTALLTMAVPVFSQEVADELGQNPFEGMTQEQRREAYDNMSDAEREQIREQLRNNPDGIRKRLESMTPEQRENMRRRFDSLSPEQRQEARERFESMTPEQREQLRERFESHGGRGQRGGGRQQTES